MEKNQEKEENVEKEDKSEQKAKRPWKCSIILGIKVAAGMWRHLRLGGAALELEMHLRELLLLAHAKTPEE